MFCSTLYEWIGVKTTILVIRDQLSRICERRQLGSRNPKRRSSSMFLAVFLCTELFIGCRCLTPVNRLRSLSCVLSKQGPRFRPVGASHNYFPPPVTSPRVIRRVHLHWQSATTHADCMLVGRASGSSQLQKEDTKLYTQPMDVTIWFRVTREQRTNAKETV